MDNYETVARALASSKKWHRGASMISKNGAKTDVFYSQYGYMLHITRCSACPWSDYLTVSLAKINGDGQLSWLGTDYTDVAESIFDVAGKIVKENWELSDRIIGSLSSGGSAVR